VVILVAAIAISLSFLIKITSIVIVAPLVYLAVAAFSDRRNSRKGDLQIVRRFWKPRSLVQTS